MVHPKLDLIVGAMVPSLRAEAPHTIRRIERDDELIEVRMVDANWVERDAQVFAVGAIVSAFPEAPREFTRDFLLSLSPVHPGDEPVPGLLPGEDGQMHEGFFVQGPIDGHDHLGRAFVCHQPGSSMVTALVASVKGLNGWVEQAAAQRHFDAMFACVRLRPGKLSERPAAITSPRMVFDFEGAVAAEEIGQLMAQGFDGHSQLAYLELAAGLFDIAEMESPVFTLDAERRFCFRADFARLAKPKARKLTIGGLPGKIPAQTWTESGDIEGLAFVRDDVLHHFAFVGFTPEAREELIASLRIRGDGPRALIERPRLDASISMFRPMPRSLKASRRAARKKKPQTKKKGRR